MTFIADVRTAQSADLVVTQDGPVADGSLAKPPRVRVTVKCGDASDRHTGAVLAREDATLAARVPQSLAGTVVTLGA
ncbi:adhesin [Escherichia coli]|nr:adhesin [Escherichia coli]